MNARWTHSIAAFAAVFFCAAPLVAAPPFFCAAPVETAAPPTISQNQPAGQARIIQDSTLVGATVADPQGQKLGLIKDVVFDSQTGRATFVVLDAEIPASGHAMLVVPYRALWVTSNPLDHRQSVLLDLRPDQLHAAPQIQNNQWQMLQNPQFLEQARNFYHIEAYTYTAARPIDNASAMSPPSLTSPSLPPATITVQPRASRNGDMPNDLPPDLQDFYDE